MTTFNENLKKFSTLQKEGLEPLRQFSEAAVDTVEKIARKNYAVIGDVLDYAVSQAHLAVNSTEPREYLEAQLESNKAFAEVLAGYANEYFELGQSVQKAAVEPVASKKAA